MKAGQKYSDDSGLHYLVLDANTYPQIDKIIRENYNGKLIKIQDQDLDNATLKSLQQKNPGAVTSTYHTICHYSVDEQNSGDVQTIIISTIPNAESVVSSYDMELLDHINTAIIGAGATESETTCNLI